MILKTSERRLFLSPSCSRRPRSGLPAAIFAGLLLLASCGGDNPACVDPPGDKKWTFMLYDAADLNDVYDPMEDFCDRMNSGSRLNVLVFQDTRLDSARIWYVGSDHTQRAVRELGEVNTGRTGTLTDFLAYAKQNYPAERYILAVYGHGQGWIGSCPDATGGNDYLTMDEMRAALAAVGGVDLVLFTGPCLMGAVESAYELRNCCDVYMGSEGLSFYAFWDEPMSGICQTLHTTPDVGSNELAEAIIGFISDSSKKWSSHVWQVDLTVSALRTDRIQDVVTGLDSLALDYLKAPERLREAMDAADPDVTVFEEHYPDIYDLATEILRFETADSTEVLLETLRESMAEAVIAECHGAGLSGAHGLTVYFPFRSHSGSTDLYDIGTGLDFIADTHWDELLEAYPYPAGAAASEGPGVTQTWRSMPTGQWSEPVTSGSM